MGIGHIAYVKAGRDVPLGTWYSTYTVAPNPIPGRVRPRFNMMVGNATADRYLIPDDGKLEHRDRQSSRAKTYTLIKADGTVEIVKPNSRHTPRVKVDKATGKTVKVIKMRLPRNFHLRPITPPIRMLGQVAERKL